VQNFWGGSQRIGVGKKKFPGRKEPYYSSLPEKGREKHPKTWGRVAKCKNLRGKASNHRGKKKEKGRYGRAYVASEGTHYFGGQEKIVQKKKLKGGKRDKL